MAHAPSTPFTRLRSLLEATRLLREEPDSASLLEAIARTVSHTLGYATVTMHTYRPAWNDFEVTTVIGAAAEPLGTRIPWTDWQRHLDPGHNRFGAYMIPVEPLEGGRWQPGDRLLVPLLHSRGHILGVVAVADPRSGRRPDDVELEVLAAVAEHAAISVEAAHDRAAAQRQQAALARLLQVSSQMTEMLSSEAVLDSICTGIGDALGFGKVALDLLEPDTDRLVMVASHGWDVSELEHYTPFTLANLEQLLDPAHESEGCYLLTHSEAIARLPQSFAVYRSTQNGRGPWAWNRHWLMVPLYAADGSVKGVIWADEPADRLVPATPLLQTLRVFANQAMAALDSSARFQEMRFLADHDPLTRLGNRRAFTRQLALAIESSSRYDQTFGLILCDLDELKAINDREGHAAGDRALVAVAGGLTAALRGSDAVFRIGGDEFAMILPEAGPEAVATVAERIAAELGGVPGRNLAVSIGTAVHPADGATADLLFHRADEAMYQRKRASRAGGRAV